MLSDSIEETLRELEEQDAYLTAAIKSLERLREIKTPIRELIRHLERERMDLIESRETLIKLSMDPRRAAWRGESESGP